MSQHHLGEAGTIQSHFLPDERSSLIIKVQLTIIQIRLLQLVLYLSLYPVYDELVDMHRKGLIRLGRDHHGILRNDVLARTRYRFVT